MSIIISPLLTRIWDGETDGGSEGTWSNSYIGYLSPVDKILGTFSWETFHFFDMSFSMTFTKATGWNMSATGNYLYFWFKSGITNVIAEKKTGAGAPSGFDLKATDGSGNYIEWHMAGSDTWDGEWKCFEHDLNNTDDIYAVSGTLDLSDVVSLEFKMEVTGNPGIFDTGGYNDIIYFGNISLDNIPITYVPIEELDYTINDETIDVTIKQLS